MSTSIHLPLINIFSKEFETMNKTHSMIHSLIFRSNILLSPINNVKKIGINIPYRFIKGETILCKYSKRTTFKDQCKKYTKCQHKIVKNKIKKSSLIKRKNLENKEMFTPKGIIKKKTHGKSKTIQVLPTNTTTTNYLMLAPKRENKNDSELTKLKRIILNKITIGVRPNKFWQIHFNYKNKVSRNNIDKTGISQSVIIKHVSKKNK